MKTIIQIILVIAAAIAFFYFKIYASVWFWVGLVIVVLMIQSELIRHYSFQMLAVIFGAIYLPMNFFLMFLTKKIAPFKNEDMIVYSIFRIFFFPIQVIVTIFSIPYEWLLDNAH